MCKKNSANVLKRGTYFTQESNRVAITSIPKYNILCLLIITSRRLRSEQYIT